MGGPVPHSYYFKNRTYDKTNKKNLFLARGAKERLEYSVEGSGANLRY